MNNLRRNILCTLLAVSVLVVLSGCGGSGDSDREKFIGRWKYTLDMTDDVNEVISQGAGDAAEYINIKSFEIDVLFTFNDDGTYYAAADEDSYKIATDNLKNDMIDSMTRYLEDIIAGMGVSETVDGLLAGRGTTMEDIIDGTMSPEMLDGILESTQSSGNWKTEKGILYLSDTLAEDADTGEGEAYEITSAGIEIKDESGKTALVLKRAG